MVQEPLQPTVRVHGRPDHDRNARGQPVALGEQVADVVVQPVRDHDVDDAEHLDQGRGPVAADVE